jgi:hypothetical protein
MGRHNMATQLRIKGLFRFDAREWKLFNRHAEQPEMHERAPVSARGRGSKRAPGAVDKAS